MFRTVTVKHFREPLIFAQIREGATQGGLGMHGEPIFARLNFREFCTLANSRENLVLVKISCYTVQGEGLGMHCGDSTTGTLEDLVIWPATI